MGVAPASQPGHDRADSAAGREAACGSKGDDSPGHLIPPPPPRAAATCSASPATVNHVTVSSPRNPNPLARDPPPGLPRHRDPLKPDATALRIKNGGKWSPRAPCFVITVPLVSLYSAPPSFSSRRLRVNIGKRPARFCPNGYNIPSSRLRS